MIQNQLASAIQRLDDCGIAVDVLHHPPPEGRVVTVRFVDHINHLDDLPVEGRITSGSKGNVIEIGWAGPDGEPLDHKQVLAHELGHHLSLDHTPLHAVDLMAPHGCELCRFTTRQCLQMRAQLAAAY